MLRDELARLQGEVDAFARVFWRTMRESLFRFAVQSALVVAVTLAAVRWCEGAG